MRRFIFILLVRYDSIFYFQVHSFTAIPVEEARKSKYVAIVITQRGGHVGFLEGILPVFHEEYICRLFTQYFNGVFTSGSEQLASINNDQ